jgi:hypothetical protein
MNSRSQILAWLAINAMTAVLAVMAILLLDVPPRFAAVTFLLTAISTAILAWISRYTRESSTNTVRWLARVLLSKQLPTFVQHINASPEVRATLGITSSDAAALAHLSESELRGLMELFRLRPYDPEPPQLARLSLDALLFILGILFGAVIPQFLASV